MKRALKVGALALWVALATPVLTACGGSGGGGQPSVVEPPPPPPLPTPPGLDTVPDAFGFVSVGTAAPGAVVQSAVVKPTGFDTATAVTVQGGEVSVAGGPYGTMTTTLPPGQSLRLRVTASPNADETRTVQVTVGGVSAAFTVTTSAEAPAVQATKTVGCPPGTTCPGQQFTDLSTVVNNLEGGDVVDVYPRAQPYPGITIKATGTAAQPILLRGVVVNGKRPVILGGGAGDGGHRHNSAVSIKFADYVTLESFEITNGINRRKADGAIDDTPYKSSFLQCVRIEGEHVTLRRVLVRDCPNHGILGADAGNGTILLDQVEVTTSGCYKEGGALQTVCGNVKHPIYIATDREIAGSKLTVRNSYLHDNIGGETIKSRAHRLEVYNSWIYTNGTNEVRSLGAFGHDTDENGSLADPIHADIVGNVFVVDALASKANSVFRFGSDSDLAENHADTYGRVRLVNNTIVVNDSLGRGASGGNPLIRLYGRLEGVMAHNNVVHVADSTSGTVQFIQEDPNNVGEPSNFEWQAANAPVKAARVLLTNNHLPSGSIAVRTRDKVNLFIAGTAPVEQGYAWSAWLPATTPVFADATDITTLTAARLRLASDSPLRNQGTDDTNRAKHPSDPVSTFALPGALIKPQVNAPGLAAGVAPAGAARTDAGSAKPTPGAFD